MTVDAWSNSYSNNKLSCPRKVKKKCCIVYCKYLKCIIIHLLYISGKLAHFDPSWNAFINLVPIHVSRWQYCTFFHRTTLHYRGTPSSSVNTAWSYQTSTVTSMSLCTRDVPSHLIQKPDVSKVILDNWKCGNSQHQNKIAFSNVWSTFQHFWWLLNTKSATCAE